MVEVVGQTGQQNAAIVALLIQRRLIIFVTNRHGPTVDYRLQYETIIRGIEPGYPLHPTKFSKIGWGG